jgi:lipoprotein-releasing system permease protein
VTSGGPGYRLARTMTLPFPLLLALRYLKSARKEAFVTFLSILATGGIALGVAALVLVLAGLSGLQTFLRTDVMARTPHLLVSWPEATDVGALKERLEAVSGVVEVRRFLRGRGWLLSQDRPLDVAVVGYEGELPRSFPDATGREPGLYIDSLIARRWNLDIGDVVEVVSPRPTLTPFGPQPRIHSLEIAGTYAIGRTQQNEFRIAVPLQVAERLFGARQTRFEVTALGFDEALEVAAEMAPLLPPESDLRTWKDLNRGLFFALRLERLLMFVSVFLIVPVSAGALVTVLGLLVSAKRGEIGMLQAMGTSPGELRRSFLALGLLLAFFGLGLGLTCGIGSAWVFDHYQVWRPGEAYFIDYIPFHVRGSDLAAVIVATVLLTSCSAVYAAHQAASLRPVEALKT